MTETYLPSRSSSRISNGYKDQLKKEIQERKRHILHLILKYLIDHNLNSTAEVLQNEAEVGNHYQVCDNIDLEVILQEYQSYYHMKFHKDPKILRKLNENEEVIIKKDKKLNAKPRLKKTENNLEKSSSNKEDDFQIEIKSLKNERSRSGTGSFQEENSMVKSLCEFENYSTEWREMADQIIKQIVPKNLGITWQDCIGLNETVELLKEAITYPINYPELFKNVRTWKGILLYGPPGTGKTLLAKALACESSGTFINVTSSTFTSKWRGESEKMVKVLFNVAKFYSPATIFIDEIDALASTNNDSNHEASRRFKSELLTQIDGILKSEEVFVLATTNTPWVIDPALLRRFEKRILVTLPNEHSRYNIFQHYLSNNGHKFNDEELVRFTNLTDNLSGSDIKTVCKEVDMSLIREKISGLKNKSDKQTTVLRKASIHDVIKAIEKVKPCVTTSCYQKHFEWNSKYGSM